MPLLITQGFAQTISLTQVGEWPGHRRTAGTTIAVAGDYAYISGGGLGVLDVSDPRNPIAVGGCDIASGSGFVIAGSYALVTRVSSFATPGGLTVVDISDPPNPTPVATLDHAIGGSAGAALHGNHLYMVEHWFHSPEQRGALLHVVDITDPIRPQPLGQCDIPVGGEPYSRLAASADRVYVCAGTVGLVVIDVSNPAVPQWIGTHQSGEETAQVKSVTVSDRYAYVGYDWTPETLEILDISQHMLPARVGAYAAGSGVNDIWIKGHHAFVSSSYDLQVFDVRDPANPLKVAEVGSGWASTLWNEGDTLFGSTPGFYGRVVLLDVSNPVAPQPLSYYPFTGGTSVAVSGRHAYVSESVGLPILDVADPTQPSRVSWHRVGAELTHVVTARDYAYLTVRGVPSDGYYAGGGLEVVDISDPSRPMRVGWFETDGPANHVVLTENVAWVAASRRDPAGEVRGRLHAIDVSNPAKPRRLGSVDTSGWCRSVAVSGDRAYVADGPSGLQIIDVSDPANPRLLGPVNGIRYADFVHVRGQILYMVGGIDSSSMPVLEIIDILNADDPRRVGRYEGERGILFGHLTVSGSYAYLNTDVDVQVVDVSNPADPFRVTAYGDSGDWYIGFPQAVAVSGGHLYLASRDRVLEILRIDGLPEEVRLEAHASSNTIHLKWPSTATGFAVETSTDPTATTWGPVPGTPQLKGDEYEMTVPMDGPAGYFRLRKP